MNYNEKACHYTWDLGVTLPRNECHDGTGLMFYRELRGLVSTNIRTLTMNSTWTLPYIVLRDLTDLDLLDME